MKKCLLLCIVVFTFLKTGCNTDPKKADSQVESAKPTEIDASETHWKQMFGPNHNSVCNHPQIKLPWVGLQPVECWRRQIGMGYSSIVGDQEVVIAFHRIDDEEIVEALRFTDGETLWQSSYPTKFECQFKYSSGPIATPVIHSDRVFTFGAEGIASCFDIKNGEVLWRRDLNTEFEIEARSFGVGASPLYVRDQLILSLGGKGHSLIALDPKTGETLWGAGDHLAGYSTPVFAEIHGQPMVFLLDNVGLSAYDFEQQKHLWTIKFRSRKPDSENSTTPIVWQDHVFVSSYSKGCMAVRINSDQSYEQIYNDRRLLDNQYNNMTLRDDHVIGFSAIDRSFKSIQIPTGELKWEWKPPHDRGNIVLLNDSILELSESGYLMTAKIFEDGPKLQKQTDSPVLKERCFSAPAVIGTCLLVRNEEEVICFGLAASP